MQFVCITEQTKAPVLFSLDKSNITKLDFRTDTVDGDEASVAQSPLTNCLKIAGSGPKSITLRVSAISRVQPPPLAPLFCPFFVTFVQLSQTDDVSRRIIDDFHRSGGFTWSEFSCFVASCLLAEVLSSLLVSSWGDNGLVGAVNTRETPGLLHPD